MNNEKYKINIIEPWESGTNTAINSILIKEEGKQFLLFVEKTIKVRGMNAHYFICKFKNHKDKVLVQQKVKGIYPLQMVFDKSIDNTSKYLPDINSYRSNFVTGEIII